MSKSLSTRLDLSLGDQLRVGEGYAKVVGISLLAAHIYQDYVVTVDDLSEAEAQSPLWMGNTDLSQDPEGQQLVASGALRIRSIDPALEYAKISEESGVLGSFKLLSWILEAALSIIIFAGILLLNTSSRLLREALQVCGARKTNGWILSGGVASAVLVFASAVALILGVGIAELFSESLASRFNQSWDYVSAYGVLSSLRWLAFIFLLLSIGGLGWVLIVLRQRHQKNKKSIREITFKQVLITVGLLALLGFGCRAVLMSGLSILYLVLVSCFSLALGLAAVVLVWIDTKLPLRTVGFYSSLLSLTLAPVMAVLVAFLTVAILSVDMNARAQSVGRPDGDNYLTVGFISQHHVDYLAQSFPEVMDSALAIELPEESERMVRIADSQFVHCERGGGQSEVCHGWISTIGFISPQSPYSDLIGKISPELAHAGAAGGLNLVTSDASSNRMTEVYPLPAGMEESERLDHAQMPGWIISPADPAARELGIHPGPDRRIYLPDFATHPPEVQARFKEAAAAVSAGVAFSEPIGITRDTGEMLVLITLILTCVIALLIGITGVLAAHKSSQPLLLVLKAYGGTEKDRLSLLARYAGVYVLACLGGALVAALLVKPAVAGRGGVLYYLDPGFSWLIAPLVLLLVSLLALLVRGLLSTRLGQREPTYF